MKRPTTVSFDKPNTVGEAVDVQGSVGDDTSVVADDEPGPDADVSAEDVPEPEKLKTAMFDSPESTMSDEAKLSLAGEVPPEPEGAHAANAEHVEFNNNQGYRNRMYSTLSNTVTELDDDTALILFRNPSFYKELFDAGLSKHADVGYFRWADQWGGPTDLVVGQPYDRVEK